jgi:hypothetical protein
MVTPAFTVNEPPVQLDEPEQLAAMVTFDPEAQPASAGAAAAGASAPATRRATKDELRKKPLRDVGRTAMESLAGSPTDVRSEIPAGRLLG